jgi:predicted nuclease of predicted toxin-antitoxin system
MAKARIVSDPDVTRRARAAQSVLLTGDKDFGELVFRRGASAEGPILLRLSGLSQSEKAAAAVEAIRRYAPPFAEAFTVIQRGRVRVRRR